MGTLNQKGQNTVEYLMMLSVVVGVVLVIGRMFRPKIAGILDQIMKMISDAAIRVGG